MILLRTTLPRASNANPVVRTLSCLYSTQLPKKAAGVFTSNKHIDAKSTPPLINKTLVYIGPFSETIRRYKMTATLFGVCGACAVPALLSTGQAPALSDVWLGFETYTFFGRKQEHQVWLSSLSDVSNKRMYRWLDRKSRRIYALERHVVDADPFLKGLSNKCGKVVG
ncbi:hypothetical protein DM01DRAFT_262485 [Hesseltinella vesiculosa]|uniref:Uncharacterized protein n=1 Tax=Hesseltinella vesiculosa TaxID=101127 RepID=A0A1X2G3J4_9FUNG|nr:hypothetical protein DM01DRAFT_262485 [Hesseltinella vesiculosa]